MDEVITVKVDQGGKTKQVSLGNGMHYLWHPINGEMRPIGMFEYGVTLRIEGNTFLRNCIFKTGPSRERAVITLRNVRVLDSTFKGNCSITTETPNSSVTWSEITETEIVAGEAKAGNAKISETKALAQRLYMFNSTIHDCDLTADTIYLNSSQLFAYNGETKFLTLDHANLQVETKKKLPRFDLYASTTEWIFLDPYDIKEGDQLLAFDVLDGGDSRVVHVFKQPEKNVRLIIYRGWRYERLEMIWPRGSFEHEQFFKQVERLAS